MEDLSKIRIKKILLDILNETRRDQDRIKSISNNLLQLCDNDLANLVNIQKIVNELFINDQITGYEYNNLNIAISQLNN